MYNWTENKKTRDLIIQQIKDANPDVICFQEYYYSSKLNFQTRDLIIKELNMHYYYEHFSHESQNPYQSGPDSLGGQLKKGVSGLTSTFAKVREKLNKAGGGGSGPRTSIADRP